MQRKKRTEKLYRRAWQRIMRIHEWIRSGDLPNCVGMAKKLAVAEKTVKRDVEFMRDSLELPIEYDAQRYGYFYSKAV
ncbi:MAG: DNA-binding protein, partial [Candidatus Diapherotrites archaeon]|nr:DNA-binding protein [Candidatus Diapherotrites archaeon]